jgi:hypothetical protein
MLSELQKSSQMDVRYGSESKTSGPDENFQGTPDVIHQHHNKYVGLIYIWNSSTKAR